MLRKKIRESPTARIFLMTFALLLGAGYYMAVTIQDPLSALVFFFVAVILVILGTYLLFITGITAMLKLLKKNKYGAYVTASGWWSSCPAPSFWRRCWYPMRIRCCGS